MEIVMKKCGLTWFLFLFALAPLCAQTESPSDLTLDRLFKSGEFRSKGFGPARWVDGGTGYTTLEPSRARTVGPAPSREKQGGRDIVCYETASGKRTILVPAARLVPSGEEKPLHIADYHWSPDGKKLLVFTNTKRVWRYHTRGDYWVLDLERHELRKIGRSLEPSTLMFAKFAPDSRRVGFVCKNDLFVEDLAGGTIRRLTDTGSDRLSNGTFDWVYEEEFSLRDGFRFSPDGRWIAYWQIDAAGIETFNLINNTDTTYPRLKPVLYPKAGTTNPSCRVGVIPAEGGETQWLAVPGDRRENYIARMEWAANSDEVVLQQFNRLQNTNRMMLGRRDSGEVRVILTERDDAWVEVHDDLKWLEGGERFIWVSERDGWQHAYIVSRSGDEVLCLTPGPYDVIRIVHVDDAGGWLYFIASPDSAAKRFLFRVSLDGRGEAKRLTPEGAGGTHSYQISPDAAWALHTASSFGVPPTVSLVRLPSHRRIRVLEDNEALGSRIDALDRGEESFFRIAISDETELDGWMIKPPGFDSKKRYPLLFYVYGEPAGQTVLDRWGGQYYLWHLLLARKGYVIVSVDNRGTPAPRGRAWRKCVYEKVGLLPSQDQAAAARAICARWPWIDPARIGIWGWSGGGSMSMNAIFRYPDIYSTAMAIATVPDQRLYDTIYIERYMGLPQTNREAYRLGSPITFADRLEGNLLIVHGTGDDNCHYQGVERLINELIRHNKKFTMMAYPNRGHSIYEGENTTRHLFTLLTGYLEENMPPGPR